MIKFKVSMSWLCRVHALQCNSSQFNIKSKLIIINTLTEGKEHKRKLKKKKGKHLMPIKAFEWKMRICACEIIKTVFKFILLCFFVHSKLKMAININGIKKCTTQSIKFMKAVSAFMSVLFFFVLFCALRVEKILIPILGELYADKGEKINGNFLPFDLNI